MNSRRLVVVARRFWPAANLSEICLSALVGELVKRGLQIDVLTPRWHRQWNSSYQVVGIDVTRVPKPASRRWRSEPFSKGLKAWFNDQQQKIDGILCWDGWKDEELVDAVADAKFPVINRLNVGLHGIQQDQQKVIDRLSAEHGKQDNRFRKTYWVCDWQSFDVVSKRNCFSSTRTFQVDDALPFNHVGTKSRTDSRLALSDSHQMLAVGTEHPLGVYIGEISADFPFDTLVRAWAIVAEKLPGAAFWFIGNGNGCEALWETLLQYEMQHCMLIVGEFDAVEDVLTASNVLIGFEHEEHTSSGVRLAMELGLPVLKIPYHYREQTHRRQTGDDVTTFAKDILGFIGESRQPTIQLDHAKASNAFKDFVDQYEHIIKLAIENLI